MSARAAARYVGRILPVVVFALCAPRVLAHRDAMDGPIPRVQMAPLARGERVYISTCDGCQERDTLATFQQQVDGSPTRAKVSVRPEFEPLVELDAIVPLSALRDGDLVRVRNVAGDCGDYARIAAVSATSFTIACRDGSRPSVTAADLAIPDPELVAYARLAPVLGLVGMALAVALIIIGLRSASRVSGALPRLRDALAADASLGPAPIAATRLEILRCGTCGRPLALTGTGAIRCACGADTREPPEYQALQREREQQAGVCEAAAARVSRAQEFAAGPAQTVLVIVGWALFCLPIAFVVLDVRGVLGGLTSLAGFDATAPLLLAPLPFTLLRRGIRAGRERLDIVLGAMAAVPGEHGLMCRHCGAPLATASSRDVLVCDYCGAQSFARAAFEAVAEASRKLRDALLVTVDLAASAFWDTLHDAIVTPWIAVGCLYFLWFWRLAWP